MKMKTDQSAPVLRMTLMLLMLVVGAHATVNIITSKQDVAVGEEILLLCKAGKEGDITWQKDDEDVDDEKVTKVDEVSSKLSIRKATLQDGGRYTCVCEFDSGRRSDVSVQLYVYDGPSFQDTVTYHEFIEGSDAVVPCRVSGKPAVEVHWLRDQKEVPPYASSRGMRVHQKADNTLRIGQINREDAGTYVCQAMIKGRPVTSRSLPISVVVNAPPSVHGKEPEKNAIAGPETNVSLVCLVDGIPKPNITWTTPAAFDPSRHQFNSDRSQLTIQAVTRADDGNYICTATNKIAENSATVMLNVFEAPAVFVSAEQLSVSLGENVSVSCNVTGHPQPERHWFNKLKSCSLGSSGRVRAEEGVLLIDEVLPSDGGMYSCMAVSTSGNASRDVAIYTQPGQVQDLSVTGGPSSVLFSLKSLPISGGTPVTNFALQWRQRQTETWEEIMVPASGPLSITSLKPYTLYTVRLAALNSVGLGQFSDMCTVRTLAIREPDSPVLSLDKMKVEGNSISVPFKQTDIGDTPLLHLNVRYRQDNADAEWKEQQVSSDADSVFLPDLSFGSDYQLELIAVNVNGTSVPAKFNFTVPPQPVKENSLAMTKGGVVGIVMVIFLLVFLAVDATCCYKNRCGLLMFIGVKLFGQKVPGLKTLEEVDGASNGEVKLKGVSTPRSSFQHEEVQTQTKGQLTEVTCDKAPLTKHEKAPPNTDLSSEA